MTLSYCVAVYNEEKIIKAAILHIQELLTKLFGSDYEIIIIDNGSNDRTVSILRNLSLKRVRLITLKQKGHGLAMRAGMLSAKGDLVMLNAIDLPFGISDIKNALPFMKNHDVVFCSKWNKKSTYPTTLKRRLASIMYLMVTKIFFDIKLSDTQGTIMMKRKSAKFLARYCDSPNAFFTTQIAIYSKRLRMSVGEVSVKKYRKPFLERQLKYSIVKDGSQMLWSLLLEKKKQISSKRDLFTFSL